MVIINPHVQHTEKSLPGAPLDYIVLGIRVQQMGREQGMLRNGGEGWK